MKDNYIKFGLEAKKIRVDLGYSRSYVEKNAHVPQETLRRFEDLGHEPKLKTLERLSDLYKIDMINVFMKNRAYTNMFSTELISDVSNLSKNLEYGILSAKLLELIDNLSSRSKDETKTELIIHFLTCCLSLGEKSTKDIKRNIMNLEDTLIELSRNRKRILSDVYLYDFEITIALLLVIQYRRIKDNMRAIELIENVIAIVDSNPYRSEHQTNQLGFLYLNLSYSYHYFDNHEKVISIVDKAIFNPQLRFSNTTYNNLMLRKVIALFKLNDPSYKLLVASICMNETPTRKSAIVKTLRDQYGIDLDTIYAEFEIKR
ncbi:MULTISPECIES: helix-turn-helix transcriptional regulator [unclassified Fusibacter]|uniref:helix-turn-helix domain-containing protein n=1 Tax=unclassified Fusibacter TaxID=2624464 RepID=UPI0010124C3D|nr:MULTISPECIES: helix-turn-helix transcriptional regulator [unclassified Fusibacter]MCK8059245.1 helix-turn-helix transcriptional regulator [Fusibacter sp. A2]NPE21291.1 helix-turn-helix transcriptional regulator [Fusibacter sp. A1]RXV62555.1 XRE family transcriptional regulator [Fusibacter sp. A1]